MTTVIGIDPGLKTGLAYYVFGGHIAQLEQLDPPEVVTAVAGIIGAQDPSRPFHIFAERFIIGTNTGKKSQQTDALRLIGALEDLCNRYPFVHFELQNTSEAKKLTTDKKLKALGWYTTGPRHRNDACRHVLFGLLRRYPEELERLMAPIKGR